MKIELKKFGTVLISRQAGKEALSAFRPTLSELSENEKIEIDFDGISVFSPSWGDEFLRPLHEKYSSNLFLKTSTNASVTVTLGFLEKINNFRFNMAK